MTQTPALTHPARPILWRWAWSLRHAPDRLLHAWRRWHAVAGLSDTPAPANILVVCHGNICRSPYAAHRLQALLNAKGLAARVVSAGFIGPDRASPGNAIVTAAARGIDLRAHRSQLLSKALVEAAQLIVVMESRQADALRLVFGTVPAPILILGDLDPWPVATRTVRDPALQSRAVFAESYDRIDRCLEVLVDTLGVTLHALPRACSPSCSA
jgi:protein-tyrosine phosphatase